MAFMDETTELEVEKNKAIRGYIVRALARGNNGALLVCQRQAENVDFRRNRMSFFGGQHSSVYSPYTPLHLPA